MKIYEMKMSFFDSNRKNYYKKIRQYKLIPHDRTVKQKNYIHVPSVS